MCFKYGQRGALSMSTMTHRCRWRGAVRRSGSDPVVLSFFGDMHTRSLICTLEALIILRPGAWRGPCLDSVSPTSTRGIAPSFRSMGVSWLALAQSGQRWAARVHRIARSRLFLLCIEECSHNPPPKVKTLLCKIKTIELCKSKTQVS